MSERVVPVMHDGAPMGDADPNGQWKKAGANYVWSRFVADDGLELELFELFDTGVVRVPIVERTMHVIPAGRPYRLSHVYGFWRASGADTVFVRSPAPGGSGYMLITGTSYDTYTEDRLFWICTGCKRELRSIAIPKSRGLNALLSGAAAAVASFNEDAAARTCPDCGAVHPTAYAMEPAQDDAIAAPARNAW